MRSIIISSKKKFFYFKLRNMIWGLSSAQGLNIFIFETPQITSRLHTGMQKSPWDMWFSLSALCERLRSVSSVISLTRDLKVWFPRPCCRQSFKCFLVDPARMRLVKQSTLISPVLHPVHTDNANLYAKDWQTLLSELLWEKRITEFALLSFL